MRGTSQIIRTSGRPSRRRSAARCDYRLLLFLLPAMAAIFLFRYVPIYGIQIAFKNFRPARGIWGSEWVGLFHFTRFLSMYNFQTVLRNTLLLSGYGLIMGFFPPIALALLLNEVRHARYKRILQTISYMPHFVSTVVVVGMIRIFLSPSTGAYGNIARALGYNVSNLLATPATFRSLYTLSGVWQGVGWNSIIYLAVLSNVDESLYEAARIEGIGRFHKIYYIDLPVLAPTISILLILSVGSLMNVSLEKVLLMQNQMNMTVSETIGTYVYKIGIQSAQYSFSAAVDLFNTTVNFVLLLAVNGLAGRLGGNTLL